MKETRAAGVIREKESLLRTVRKRENPSWFCEQAAARALLSALPGAACAGIAPETFAASGSGFEPDSCAKQFAAAGNNPHITAKTHFLYFLWLDKWFLTAFIANTGCSILGRAQYRGKILRKARPRQNFVAACGLRLRCQLRLHVRQKSHDTNVFVALTHFFNGFERLAARVQVHNHEFWSVLH
jgi:hypothetical protein